VPREPKDGYSLSTMRLISRELKKIRAKQGIITADNVLETARDPAHPLHRFFDWDDATAAEKYRRQQATQMISRVTVRVEIDGEQRPVRAFLGVDRDAVRQYLPAAEVLDNAGMRAQILAEMKNDLDAMRKRYELYEHCGKAVLLVRKAIASLEESARRRA
jgi:hypothetical protein